MTPSPDDTLKLPDSPPNGLSCQHGQTARVGIAALFLAIAALASAQAADPVITEFMASNTETLILEGGGTPDWIELHNPGATELDLAGWHLSNSSLDPTGWTFPQGATIAAGAYLLVYASGDESLASGGNIHTDFKLAAGGEYLALARPDGTVQQQLSPTYP
jgi:hypothetical protein